MSDFAFAVLQNLSIVTLFWIVAIRLLVRDVEGEEVRFDRCFGMGWLATLVIGFFIIQPEAWALYFSSGSYSFQWWSSIGIAGLLLMIGSIANCYDSISLTRAWSIAFLGGAFAGLMRTIYIDIAIGGLTLAVAFGASMAMIHYEYAVRLPRKKAQMRN